MPSPKPLIYPSKRDTWLTLLLWAAVLTMLVGATTLWEAPLPLAHRLGFALLLLASSVFVLWILYGTYYTLTACDLIIRSGPFRWTVPLHSITRVFPTTNPLSSPACSLDRLHIGCQGSRRGVMISPLNKPQFLKDLQAQVPSLQFTASGTLQRKD